MASEDNIERVVIREGKAEIHFPNSNEVFYNPVQELNRDLSTAVISLFSELTRDKGTGQTEASGGNGKKQDEVTIHGTAHFKKGKKIWPCYHIHVQ